MPAPSENLFYALLKAAGQNRPDVAGKEAHGSAAGWEYGGEFQAPGDDRGDVATKIALNN